jgi:translocation and assembly module TamB
LSSHPIKLKWRLLEMVVLLGVISLGALFVSQIGKRLDRRMEHLKNEVLQMLEQRIERRIGYGSISPSVFGYLGIRDLVIYSYEDPDEVLVRISRVKVYYNIFRFLATREPVLALSEIQIANSYFEINYERDRELLELFDLLRTGRGAGPAREPRSHASILTRLFGEREEGGDEYPGIDLSGANITLLYTYGDWQLRIANLFFSVSSGKQLYELAIRGYLEARRTSWDASSTWLTTRVKITGQLDRSLAWSDLAVRLYSLSTDSLEIQRQTLQVSYDKKSLKVRKIQDRSPLDIQFLFDTSSRDLSLDFNAENLKPGNLFQLTGRLERFNKYLASSVSSSGTLTVNLDDLSLRYSADLQVTLPKGAGPGEMSISTRITGNEEVLYFSPLALNSSRGSVEFFGNILIASRLPAGLIRIENFEPMVGRTLNANLNVRRNVETVTIHGSSLSVGGTVFDSFDLDLRPAGKEIGFSLQAAVGSSEETGNLQAAGSVNWASTPKLTVAGLLNGIPLNTVYRLAVAEQHILPAAARRLRSYTISAEVEASMDSSGFTLAAEKVEILEPGEPANAVRFSLAADQDTLSVEEFKADWQGYTLTGQVNASRNNQDAELNALLRFEDTPYRFDLKLLSDQEVRLEGSYGLKGRYLLSKAVKPLFLSGRLVQIWGHSFSLESEEFPIPLHRETMFVSLGLEGVLDEEGSLYAVSRSSQVRNLPLPEAKNNSLELGFQVNRNKLVADRIVYRDEVSILAGSGAAEFGNLLPLRASAAVELGSQDTAERYNAEIRLEGNRVHGQLVFNRAPLERFGAEVVRGNLSGLVSADGELPAPDLHVAVALEEGRLNLDPLELDLVASYSQEKFSLEDLNLRFLSHRIEGGNGSLDLNSGDFSFLAGYRADYLQRLVDLRVNLQGTFAGIPSSFKLGNLLEQEMNAVIELEGITVDSRSVPPWEVALKTKQGMLAFDGGPEQSIHGKISRDGTFTVTLLDPLPIQGRAEGILVKDKLDSVFTVNSLDMRIINTLTPTTDIFTFTAGKARGNLRISGPVNDPDWIGYLDVMDAELLFKPAPDPLKPLNGRLIFDGKSFVLPRTASYSGRARVEGEGTFYLDHWKPEALELTFYVEEPPGVHIRYTFDPVSVDGYATGTIRVRADSVTTILDGTIKANSCRIALERPQNEPSSVAAPASPLSVDLQITTGRSVEFFWPAMNFPIVRTYARQGEQVDISLDQDTGEFTMTGQVEIRGGEVFYFDRSFYLKQGSITFEESLDEFDPWIYALAEARERDLNNEEIKIFLEADNKLSLFSPRFYSEPSRPDVEILNLIGGSIVNRFEETDFGTAAVMLTSDIIGQFGILTPFERAVRDILNLDLFSVRTQFLQNVLIGKIRGENLAQEPFNPLDNTTLTLGKYLGTDLFLEALVRFQAVDELTSSSDIRTEGELNLEWVTPFFLLEWTFTPTHPENLFLSDNSIGLSWKFSY